MANPNIDPQILAGLEVLRRGPAALSDPELAYVADAVRQDASVAERLAKIQRADSHLATAFHDVAVPANLEQRILDRLATDTAVVEDAEVAGPQAADAGEEQLAEQLAEQRPVDERRRSAGAQLVSSRRTWSCVAVAASVVLAFFLWPRSVPTDRMSPEYLLDQAIAFFHTDNQNEGVSLSESRPPSGLEASSDVRHTQTSQWRQLDFLGVPAVAYDLMGPRGETATLYVSRRRVEQLDMVMQPSAEPWLATGGVSATCWQVEDQLFVLVVAGGREQYDAFVRQPGSTVAFYWPTPARLAQAA